MISIPPLPSLPKGQIPSQDSRARQAALQLEATFLSEMLKSAGFGTQENSFSGGSGEDHFASFHRDAIAERIVQAGGLGLSEYFFNAMMEVGHAKPDTK